MVLSIDEVGGILDGVCEEFPEELFQELNGGVLLLEEALPDPDAGEDVYIMGEYCWDEMGRYINIYYGSFAALLFDEPRRVWEDELRTTLRHELTHHVEGLAGPGIQGLRPAGRPAPGGRLAINQKTKERKERDLWKPSSTPPRGSVPGVWRSTWRTA